jgi:ribonuclease HI
MKLIIHTDGGARGNPGPAAIGVVIENVETKKVTGFGKTIGETTNNVAEYTGVIEALKTVKTMMVSSDNQLDIQFFLDSTLVVNQINGLFKVKDTKLRELLSHVRILEGDVGGEIRYTAVRREQNVDADMFVNKALDEQA